MNLGGVMDEVAERLRTIDGLRVHAYPPDTVHPPAAVVTYPPSYDYDAAFGNGMDTMRLSVVVLVGKVSDRSSRDLISAWLSNSGDKRYRLQNIGQLTKYTIAGDTPNVSVATVDDDYLRVELASGNDVGFSNLREVLIRQGLVSADFRAQATFDPPTFGNVGPGLDILPQHGLVLRYQRDTIQRAVVLSVNIFFSVPFLNVGVWQANLDGSSFNNRNAAGWPLPLGLALPYTVDATLVGNVVQVRQWHVGDIPPGPAHATLSRTFNLDTDTGDSVAIPSPVGLGSAGLVAAHLGTDDRSAIRYPLKDLYWEAASDSIKETLEAGRYAEFDTVRVQTAEFDMVRIGAVDYLAATLTLDIAGNGD